MGSKTAISTCRLEQFSTDAEPLWGHLGFRLTLTVEKRVFSHADYCEIYTDSDAEIVAKLCRDDIARYGYHFF